MSESSGEDCAPSEDAVGRQSAKDDPAEPGTATENDSGEEDKHTRTSTRTRMFVDWQTLIEISRAEYDSEEIEDSIYDVARDEIKPKLSVNAYRLLKRKSRRGVFINVWKFKRTDEFKTENLTVSEYRCPIGHRGGCKVRLRVARAPSSVCLSIAGHHSLQSHDEKHLTLTQR